MSKFLEIIEILKDRRGIEFGGPTELFSNSNCGMFLYPRVNLDGGNIIENNKFQKNINSKYFYYSGKSGEQYNIDCSNKEQIKKLNKYDFVVTSHVIEHIANPIQSIINWKENILNEGGYILSILPDYRYCFDRNRPLTTIEHLIEDYKNNTGEDDQTHIEEAVSLNTSKGWHRDWSKYTENNFLTRVIHHHTFTIKTVDEMFKYCGLKKILSFKQDDLNIVNLSRVES